MKSSSQALRERLGTNAGPLYLVVATSLRRDIETGRLEPGARLPALDQLAKEMGVSIITLRHAVETLEREGLIERRHGVGTFVSRDPKTRQWLVLKSNWDSLLAHLHDKKPTTLAVFDAIQSPSVGPDEGKLTDSYRYMRRVHSWEGTPYALIDIYLDRQTYLRKSAKFDENMVIAVLADMPELKIRNLHQSFAFTTADAHTAELLGIPVNAPVGDVRRVITNDRGEIIYVGETKYRGDFVKVEMNLRK